MQTGGNGQSNHHMKGLFAGLGIGLVVGLVMAFITYAAESEYLAVDIIGLILVGLGVTYFVPNKSVMGAVTGGVSCGFTYLLYLFVTEGIMGMEFENGETLDILFLLFAVGYGAYMGYRGKAAFEEE